MLILFTDTIYCESKLRMELINLLHQYHQEILRVLSERNFILINGHRIEANTLEWKKL